MAIDILGDEKLELVAGNKIYGVDIDRNTATAKSLTLLSSVTPPAGCPNDGVTVIADFNNDGKLEVLVRRKAVNSTAKANIYLYLWSPHTGTATGNAPPGFLLFLPSKFRISTKSVLIFVL